MFISRAINRIIGLYLPQILEAMYSDHSIFSRYLKSALFLVLVLSISTSCVSRKKLTYLQFDEETQARDSVQYALERRAYHLQVNDIVNIDVRSLNPEANLLFNSSSAGGNNNLMAGDIIFYIQGYSIDGSGNIYLPVLGEVNVLGLTIEELSDTLDLKLSKYFQSGSVYSRVQLAGIRFSVVGDVSRPGKYVIYQNQATVFDALALTGDITIVGDRRNVQIVRQYPEGVKLFEIDLTNSDVLSDPRFFIQPNDIINVKPMRVKTWGIGTTGWQSITLGLSALASALTIIFTLNSLSQ